MQLVRKSPTNQSECGLSNQPIRVRPTNQSAACMIEFWQHAYILFGTDGGIGKS
jgi:hypothetical protein